MQAPPPPPPPPQMVIFFSSSKLNVLTLLIFPGLFVSYNLLLLLSVFKLMRKILNFILTYLYLLYESYNIKRYKTNELFEHMLSCFTHGYYVFLAFPRLTTHASSLGCISKKSKRGQEDVYTIILKVPLTFPTLKGKATKSRIF